VHRGPLPDLESLRCFVEAARTLNFRAASRAVGLTPAALGQRIQKLEDQLDVRLFHRTTRKVELTEAGLALLPQARTTLEAAWECTRAARGELGPAPMELWLGTRHELGLSWLAPLLPALREEFPGVTFHLYFGSGPDLELRVRTQQIDCAISSRRITDPRVEGLKVHAEEYVLCGAPSLLERQPLDTQEDLAEHVLVDIGPDLPLLSYWRDAQNVADGLRLANVRYMGTIAAIRTVVLAGEGIGVLPEYLIRGDLALGRLRPVLPEVVPGHDWFRLIVRVDDPRRSFLQRLADAMKTHPLA
jgi:LysR family transcriptional regulator, glycine cleavage system transcriptional activator